MKLKKYTEEIYPTALEQVLCGRGVEDLDTWLSAGWEQINDWRCLDYIVEATTKVHDTVQGNNDIIVVVDCDVDGYTSAAIFINYLYAYYPEYVKGHVSFLHHQGKEHGLKDLLKQILEREKTENYLVICPDSASNDLEEHKIIYKDGGFVACYDHHIASFRIPESIIVNPQLDNYPNKSITGAGVTWQFCRAYDNLYHKDNPYANLFLDLCAIGDSGDMADYREPEIRAFMNLGLNNIQNPFFKALAEKNEYSINKMNGINYHSCSFYIVPLVNSIVRSGTAEEKELIFKAMLTMYCNEEVESSKRGEKGLKVPLYQEAVLIAERVKRRQTKLQDEAMVLLEEKIKDENLLDNAVIVLLCEPGMVERNLAGLCANKIQSKYQKPCVILTKTWDKELNDYVYAGSARNYSMSEIQNFKDVCENTNVTNMTAGQMVALIHLFCLSAGF